MDINSATAVFQVGSFSTAARHEGLVVLTKIFVIETIHSQVSHKQKNTQLATFNEVQYSTPTVLW